MVLSSQAPDQPCAGVPEPVLLWPAIEGAHSSPYDAQVLQQEFEKQHEQLFEPEDELSVIIIELQENLKPTTTYLTTTDEIIKHTQNALKRDAITIILVEQSFSWGEIEISKSGAQALLGHYGISHGFWSVLKLFGSKENADHECSGGFNEEVRADASRSYEISYTAKHFEEHGKPDAHDPWSLRQVGVDHTYKESLNSHTFVVIRPPDTLLRRLQGIDSNVTALKIHTLLMCTVTERWSQYMIYLESVCAKISQKAILAKDPQQTKSKGFDLYLADSQSIQLLQDTVVRGAYQLTLNCSIFDRLTELSDAMVGESSFQSVDSPTKSKSNEASNTLANLRSLSQQTRIIKSHAESILRRLDGIATLVRSILDAQALEALQTSSNTTAELAMLAREDAKKATESARTLNSITILGYLYLPASFVATLLGTQYITVHKDHRSGNVSIHLAAEMWIFMVLTITLLLFTACFWFIWKWRIHLDDKAKEREAQKTV